MPGRLIEWARNGIGHIFPESRFKELIRSLLFRYYNPLDALGKIVAKVAMLEDGTLLIELNDGLKFYVQRDAIPDKMTDFLIRYRNCRILPKIDGLEYCGTIWHQLLEQYVDDIYQKYYKVKKGDIVVDAGAHIGLFTVKAGKAVGDEGMVIAMEPEINNLRFLERNIGANGLGNVAIVKKGVWSARERLKLFIRKETSSHSFLNPSWDSNTFVEVEVDTVDNILRELGIKTVDFIKMDIEGAELEAYKGMKETLKANNVKLAIAAYHKVGGKRTYKAIARWLSWNGFEVRVPAKKGEEIIVYAYKNQYLN